MKKFVVAAVIVVGILCGAADCSPQQPEGSKHDGGNVLPMEASKKKKKVTVETGKPTNQVTMCVFKSSNCGAKK